jgi:hypothetical protein
VLNLFDVLCLPLLVICLTVQSRAEKENSIREAAERAEERKKKKLATQKKAAERERDLKNKTKRKRIPFNVLNQCNSS